METKENQISDCSNNELVLDRTDKYPVSEKSFEVVVPLPTGQNITVDVGCFSPNSGFSGKIFDSMNKMREDELIEEIIDKIKNVLFLGRVDFSNAGIEIDFPCSDLVSSDLDPTLESSKEYFLNFIKDGRAQEILKVSTETLLGIPFHMVLSSIGDFVAFDVNKKVSRLFWLQGNLLESSATLTVKDLWDRTDEEIKSLIRRRVVIYPAKSVVGRRRSRVNEDLVSEGGVDAKKFIPYCSSCEGDKERLDLPVVNNPADVIRTEKCRWVLDPRHLYSFLKENRNTLIDKEWKDVQPFSLEKLGEVISVLKYITLDSVYAWWTNPEFPPQMDSSGISSIEPLDDVHKNWVSFDVKATVCGPVCGQAKSVIGDPEMVRRMGKTLEIVLEQYREKVVELEKKNEELAKLNEKTTVKVGNFLEHVVGSASSAFLDCGGSFTNAIRIFSGYMKDVK